MASHYSIDVRSDAPVEINVQNLGAQQAYQHHHAAAAPPAFQQAFPAAAQIQHPRDSGLKFSFRDVVILTSIAPAYYVFDHLSKMSSDIDPHILMGGLAVTGIGAAALYSPTVRRVLSASASLGCGLARQAWKWGVAAPINGVRNYGGAVARGLLSLGASSLSVARRTLAGIGKTGTALTAGAVRVATNTIGEVGKAAGTLIESAGNVVPELTGLALTAGAAYYFGIPYLMGTPDQAPPVNG